MQVSRLIAQIHLPSEKEIRLFLIRFFIVGLIGFALPVTQPLFRLLTPYTLLLSFLLILMYELTANRKRGVGYFLLFIGVVYILSFFVEVIGVNTGVLFGHYRYGNTLGVKIAHTPLLIGVNWVLLALGAAAVSNRLSSSLGFSETRYIGTIFRIITGAFLMLTVDFVLERVAPWMDMWSWQTVRVPGRNYLAWFLLSLIFQSYYVLVKIQQRTRIAATLFILEFFFLLLLFFYIRFL